MTTTRDFATDDFLGWPQPAAGRDTPQVGRAGAAKAKRTRTADAPLVDWPSVAPCIGSTAVQAPEVNASPAAAPSKRAGTRARSGRGRVLAERTASSGACEETAHPRRSRRIAAASASAVAAADDAHVTSAAGIAPKGVGRADRPTHGRSNHDRDACAAVALSRKDISTMSKNQRNGSNSVATAGGPAEVSAVPAENEELKKATDPAALADGPSYVRAVAAQVDLVGASAKLIVSTDEKIVKAELDRLRELIFGKGGPAPSDEALRIDWSSMTRSASDSGSGAEKSAELPEGELHGRH